MRKTASAQDSSHKSRKLAISAFCISCAPSVDIPAACAAKFSFPKRAEEKTIAPTQLNGTFPRFFLTHVHPTQSLATLFFNCTKNTELTALAFARTVTFAPTTKVKTKTAEGHQGRRIQ
jgi:hypothetical protein